MSGQPNMPPSLGSTSDLFDRYGAAVYRRCRSLLDTEEEAHDAVQEVFLKVHARGDSFRGGSSPLTFLYAVATTHCLQLLRNRSRREAKLAALPPPCAQTDLEGTDARVLWQAVFAQLDPQLQQLAVLRHVDDLTLEEIAAATGVTRKTVSRKLALFEAYVRARLSPEGAPP